MSYSEQDEEPEKGPTLTRWCRYKLIQKTADQMVQAICQELMKQNGQSLSKNIVQLVKKIVVEVFQDEHSPNNIKGELNKLFVTTLKHNVSSIKDTKGLLHVLIAEKDPDLADTILYALQNAAKINSADDVKGLEVSFIEEPLQLLSIKSRPSMKRVGGNKRTTRKVQKNALKKRAMYKKKRLALYSRKRMVGGQSEQSEQDIQTEKETKKQEIEKRLNEEKEKRKNKINSDFDILKKSYDQNKNISQATRNEFLEEPTRKRDADIKLLDDEYAKKMEDELKKLDQDYMAKLDILKQNAKRLIEFSANKERLGSERAANKENLANLTGMTGSLRRGLSSVADVGRSVKDAASYAKHTSSSALGIVPGKGTGTQKAVSSLASTAGKTLKSANVLGALGKMGSLGIGAVSGLGSGLKLLGKGAGSGLGALGKGAMSGLSGAASLASSAFSKKNKGDDEEEQMQSSGNDEVDAEMLMSKYQEEILDKLAADLDTTVNKIKQRVLAAISENITSEQMQKDMRMTIHTSLLNRSVSGFSPNLKKALVQSVFTQNKAVFAQALNFSIKELAKNKKVPDFKNNDYLEDVNTGIWQQLPIIIATA